MARILDKTRSVRFKLFFIMCIIITIIIACLILVNNIGLEAFYMYTKIQTVKELYDTIDGYYTSGSMNESIESELSRIAFNNNFDIFIKTTENSYIFSTDKDFSSTLNQVLVIEEGENGTNNVLYENEDIEIVRINDTSNNISYLLLTGTLSNGYILYIRIPVVPIEESVQISNRTLVWVGIFTVLVSAVIAFAVSKNFTAPILELNDIANKMAKLDFSKKYKVTDAKDEINTLGRSINTMSDKLESTIKQLRANNIELEKDIEEKSKIDEMRKQFISDVSHELKTPIALIQGYAEGLIENVNTDEESRKFYADVILDEANKMDKLVKQLLELMKLEYGKREFNDRNLDIVEMTHEIIRKCHVMLEEKQIDMKFEGKEAIFVNADEFYIDQLITNYFTNAIKHCDEKDGKKEIEIKIERIKETKKVRFSISNTGENIKEEDMERIWTRFYKVDSSRNRENGGSGIGLALVRAIMLNYNNNYGVINHENGVEFYFELDEVKPNENEEKPL